MVPTYIPLLKQSLASCAVNSEVMYEFSSDNCAVSLQRECHCLTPFRWDSIPLFHVDKLPKLLAFLKMERNSTKPRTVFLELEFFSSGLA